MSSFFIKQEGVESITKTTKSGAKISAFKKTPDIINRTFYNKQGFITASEIYSGEERILSSETEYLISGDTLEVRVMSSAIYGKEYKNDTTIHRFYFNPKTNHFYRMEQFRVGSDNTLIATDLTYSGSLLVSYTLNDSEFTYLYNDDGLLIKHERNSDKYNAQVDFIYDESGRITDNIIQEYWPLIGEPETIHIRKGVTMTTTDRSQNTWMRYEDFDENGNWQKSYYITDKGKKKGLDKKLASIREISYYQ